MTLTEHDLASAVYELSLYVSSLPSKEEAEAIPAPDLSGEKNEMVTRLDTDVVDVPNLGLHIGHGQREGKYDSMPAMRRLIWRKFKKNPMGLPRYLWKNIKLELAARIRAKQY